MKPRYIVHPQSPEVKKTPFKTYRPSIGNLKINCCLKKIKLITNIILDGGTPSFSGLIKDGGNPSSFNVKIYEGGKP